MNHIKNKRIESIIHKNLSSIIILNGNNYYISIVKVESFKENNIVNVYINFYIKKNKEHVFFNIKNIVPYYKKQLFKKLKNNFRKFPKIQFYIKNID